MLGMELGHSEIQEEPQKFAYETMIAISLMLQPVFFMYNAFAHDEPYLHVKSASNYCNILFGSGKIRNKLNS
jgi:hypothetical protein